MSFMLPRNCLGVLYSLITRFMHHLIKVRMPQFLKRVYLTSISWYMITKICYENIYRRMNRNILNSSNSLVMHSTKSLCVKIMKSYYYIQNNAAYWTQFRRILEDWKKVLKNCNCFWKHRVVYGRVGGYLEQKLRRDIPWNRKRYKN